jgi:hypothetical protein
VLRTRFGGLRKAYELIGYPGMRGMGFIDVRRRIQALREEIILEIATTFSGEATVIRSGGRRKTQLSLRNLPVSVMVARSIRVWKNTVRWLIKPVLGELEHLTLLAQMDERNESVQALHLLPGINRGKHFHIEANDAWLERGIRLRDLQQFCDAARTLASSRFPTS